MYICLRLSVDSRIIATTHTATHECTRIHDRTQGIDLARDEMRQFIESEKVRVVEEKSGDVDRELLMSVARTSLRTKLAEELGTYVRIHTVMKKFVGV